MLEVPYSICDFFNLERGIRAPKTEVAKRIYEYVRKHNLRILENNSHSIIVDYKLKKLFDYKKDTMNFEEFKIALYKLYNPKIIFEI